MLVIHVHIRAFGCARASPYTLVFVPVCANGFVHMRLRVCDSPPQEGYSCFKCLCDRPSRRMPVRASARVAVTQ